MTQRELGAEWPSRATTPGASRLLTLGRLVLERGQDGTRVGVSQRRKLVVLAYLGLAARPVSRDVLVEMFWGDEDEERARHSLSNILSFLRGFLGADAIAARKSDVAIDNRAALEMDAQELAAAARAARHDRVVELYQGPFLDGVHVRDSASFDAWVSRERARLESLFTASCSAACTSAAAAADWTRCADVARRWLDVAPQATEAGLHLLHALRAHRTPAHRRLALAEYDRLRLRLAREHDAEPHPHLVELARRIQERVQADDAAAAALLVAAEPDSPAALAATGTTAAGPAGADPVSKPALPEAASPPGPIHSPPGGAARASRPPVGLGVSRLLAAAALAAGVFGVALIARRAPAHTVPRRPLVAVTDIANVRGDTAASWLEDGLAQLLASDLARSPAVEVITPTRIRETRRREKLPISGALDQHAALDVAGRLGATLVVRGGFTRGVGGYLLDVTVRDVATSHDIGSVTVSGPDPTELADRAAARLLQSAIGAETQPRYTDPEAANLAAYQHYIRALQARTEGRLVDARREVDAALAIDSAFGSALTDRAAMAREEGDTLVLSRLAVAMRRAHFSQWDLTLAALDSAEHNGEQSRSEALARRLVATYPHDPRSYSRLAALLENRGEWANAERVTAAQLALDSLAVEAGNGPCVPCSAYRALVDLQLTQGNLAGAERTARRWLALQPDLPAAWADLGEVLEARRQHGAALEADRRALALSGDDPTYRLLLARTFVMAGRLDAADSLLATTHDLNAAQEETLGDIRVLTLRERGRYRASIALSEELAKAHLGGGAVLYEEMDALGRVGEFAAAEQLFSKRIAPPARTSAMPTYARGDAARWFAWTRALEANTLAGARDTVRLRAIADSLERIGPLSYYGRDWRLFHHVRGLLAMLRGAPLDAAIEFERARWGVAGWTTNLTWLARAQLGAGRPDAAISTLRHGYESPLDAMGRYVPRSELDYLMSVAFRQAGMRDSSAAYAQRLRHAWAGADAEVRRRLEALDGGPAGLHGVRPEQLSCERSCGAVTW